ncbi:hypothetical protein JK324_14760 [Klebsiella oxytoca]|uniref:hypothetical protein n=1 Tax=Klebsiella oxytoca TaxID=571 RepID=UPI001092775F|nr:hypothetical protein [Klebsiella oxytoca]MBL0807849.1 hypothetical protein [Klebsiella oxytoca]TGN44222.1 hypothetical protein E5Q62_14005 [Klebsiella oxytoca]
MSWEKDVAACFGVEDCRFAVHPLDVQRAQTAIADAKAAGASFNDFVKEMVWHIYQRMPNSPVLHTHIQTQVVTAQKMW